MHRRLATALVLTAIAPLGRIAWSADRFETPPTLRAAAAAPADLVKGNGFHVDDAVPTDGLTTLFRLRSDVGTFEVHGVETLALRVSELPALRELSKASKTDTFTHALAETAKRPVKAAAQMVTHPVETAKGIPSGLGRFFDRVEAGGKRLYDTATDDRGSGTQRAKATAESTGQAAADALGLEQERRKLAKQLGVDPYTTNAALSAKLEEFAKVAFYGRVGLNTLISVMVPASIIITGTSATRDLVYDTPRGDLIVRNENALRAMGVGDGSVRALQRAKGFTLSLQTELIRHLEALGGVKGRPAVVALAGTAATTDQGLFLVRAVRMLAARHAEHPLTEIDAVGTVFARDADGGIVVPGAVDYVSWTSRVARFANRADLKAPTREARITGRMTPMAKSGFEKLGWTVVENAR
ncbi:MAG TPA: hypothetical protein VGR62_07375 [Candidatus Binatia bacterium]|jgi:hypothetical protein|nr:hypothetical protein [Candidatus Binatia bacterium]